MAITYYYPNGNDGGWAVSTNTLCDDGFNPGNGLDNDVTGPNDATFITCTDQAGDALNLDTGVGSGEHTIVDGDTISLVRIKVRATLNASDSDNNILVDLIIGGVAQGTQQETGHLTSGFVTYTLSTTGWDSDWTAAQIAGMQVRLTSEQGGMPASYDVDVSEVEVEITYTAGGLTEDPLTADPSPTFAGQTPTAVVANVVNPLTDPLQFIYVIGLKLEGQPLTIDVTAGGDNTELPLLAELDFAGQLPTTAVANNVSPGIVSPSPTFTGYAPSAVVDNVTLPGIDTLVLGVAGSDPVGSVGNVVLPGIDELVLGVSGNDPTASVGFTTLPGIDELVLGVSGSDPTVLHDRVAAPDTVALSFGVAGSDPVGSVGNVALPGIDELVLGVSGNDPVAVKGQVELPLLGTLDLGIAGSAPSAVIANVTAPAIDELVFGVTGSDPVASVGTTRTPAIDELVLGVVGSDPTTVVSNVVLPTTAALSFGEQTPVAVKGQVELPLLGTLDLGISGSDVTVLHDRVADPTTVALVIDEQAADRVVTSADTPEPGVVALSLGVAGLPTAVVDNVVLPGIDELVLSGQQPTLGAYDNPEEPGTAALALASAAPTVLHDRVSDVSLGTLLFDGKVPTLGTARTVDPSVGSLTLSPQDVSLYGTIEVPTGGLNIYKYIGLWLEGIPPQVLFDRVSYPTTGALSFAADAPNVVPKDAIAPNVGSMTYAGGDVTVVVTIDITVPVVALSLSGQTPVTDISVYPGTGALVLESLKLDLSDTANLTLEGQPVTIFYRDGTLIVNPGATTDAPSNYEECDLTGFRQMPGSMKLQWNRYAVRQKSYDSRHPADKMKGKPDRRKRNGQQNAEQDNSFITTDIDPEDL